MRIFRKIIDDCTSLRSNSHQVRTKNENGKEIKQVPENPLEPSHIEDLNLNRRDFEKVVSLGAIALPVLVSEVPLAKAVEIAGGFLGRVGVGTGEASLLKGTLEWGLSQFAPEFTFEFPNEKDFRTSTSKSLLHGVGERGKDFPITELLKLKNKLPILRRAAQGEKISPGGHIPQEDVPGPWASGYPVNFEHVVECPYCLGKWAEGWFEMVPQYGKLLKIYSDKVSEVKMALPNLTKQGILESARQFYKARKDKDPFYYPPSDDGMSDVLIGDYLKNLENYISRARIEELRKSFGEILDEELSSLQSWYADLVNATDEIKELPGLLKRIEPYAIAQDMELILETEKNLRGNLEKSLQGAEGRFVILEIEAADIIDDFMLIRQVINSDPHLRRNIKVEKFSRSRIDRDKMVATLKDLPAIVDELPAKVDEFVKAITESPKELVEQIETFSIHDMKNFMRFMESNELVIHGEWPLQAVQIAINHAREHPHQKLGIAFPGDHMNALEMARWYAGEIYLFELIAEELYSNFGVEVSFMYSFEHEYEKTPEEKYIRKQQTYSNYLCQWARGAEIGVNIVRANLSVGEGLYRQLRMRYEEKPSVLEEAEELAEKVLK